MCEKSWATHCEHRMANHPLQMVQSPSDVPSCTAQLPGDVWSDFDYGPPAGHQVHEISSCWKKTLANV